MYLFHQLAALSTPRISRVYLCGALPLLQLERHLSFSLTIVKGENGAAGETQMARRTTIRWWAPSACWYNSRYNSNILFLFSSRQVSSIALAVYIWCAQNKKGKTTATEHTAARTTLAESISFCRLCLSFGFFSFDAFILFDIASTLWLFICSILSARGGIILSSSISADCQALLMIFYIGKEYDTELINVSLFWDCVCFAVLCWPLL